MKLAFAIIKASKNEDIGAQLFHKIDWYGKFHHIYRGRAMIWLTYKNLESDLFEQPLFDLMDRLDIKSPLDTEKNIA